MDHHPTVRRKAYPVSSQRPRITPGTGKWWALGIAFTLAFTGFASWKVLSVADQAIDVTLTAVSVVDDRTTVVTFDLHRPPAQAVVCTVQAQDQRKAVVGTATVDLPPATERTTTHQVTVKTTTRAFTGLVHDCVRA